jgi:hypothetical protein
MPRPATSRGESVAATEAPVHYRHTQIGWVLLVVLAALGAFLYVQLQGSGVPTPWLPLGILAVILVLMGTLTVDVDRERVQTAFGIGLIRKTVPLADIAAFQPVRNPWIAGWGIRLIRGGQLWNVSGLDAVELALRDGRFFRIGTDEPEALARAIQHATGRAPSDTRAGAAGGLPSAPKRSPYFFYVVGAIVLLGAALALLPVIVQMKPPAVTVGADGFDVQSAFYGQGYRADEITAIEILDRMPVVEARTNGFSGGGLLRGHFRVRGLGEGKLFVDTGTAPFILVRLRESFVILNLDAPEKTAALFDEMASAWPDKVVPRPQ